MRWSESETLKFVNIYLEHEYLWNPYDPDYKCREKRQQAYKDIISRFSTATDIVLDEVDLRVKIKNLRSTYVQELTKIKQRSGPDFVYKPSIKWFPEWHKCFNAIKQRSASLEQQGSFEDTNQNIWLQQNDLDDRSYSFETESDDYLTLKSEIHYPSPDQGLNSNKMKRKKLKQRKWSPIYQNADSTVKEDEFDIYGKYIASQLRSMDLHRALRVQLDIHGIVNEARMSCLTDN